MISQEQNTGPQCRSCGDSSEQRNGFCGNCGADLTEPQSRAIPNTATAEENTASLLKTESQTVKAISGQTRSAFSSAFKKKINHDLAEAFSSVDPRDRPWFGLDFDVDLLAITPYNVLVAALVDPGPTGAIIYKSLFPEGPWLLTMPDGTDRAIDNPLVNVMRAMRTFEDKLAAFFKHQKKTFQLNRVKGLIVFPDKYDLKNANEPYTFAEGNAGVRVINASELPKEMLQPARQARLSPEPWSEWLYTSVLPSRDDDSIASTWLDANGNTTSKHARTFTARKSPDEHRTLPPMSSRVYSHPAARPRPRKAKRRLPIVAGLTLVVVLGSMALWDVYAPTGPIWPSFLARVLEKNIPTPEPSKQGDSTSAKEPAQMGVPADRNSTKSDHFSNGNRLPEVKMPDSEAPDPVSPVEKSFPDASPPSTSAWQKTIEYQISRAIQQRAVDGVLVVFVNDTAYLTGTVFSRNQKAAAEKAARNVPGVKRVQSSISVKWETG